MLLIEIVVLYGLLSDIKKRESYMKGAVIYLMIDLWMKEKKVEN